eukprot:gene30146-37653_t
MENSPESWLGDLAAALNTSFDFEWPSDLSLPEIDVSATESDRNSVDVVARAGLVDYSSSDDESPEKKPVEASLVHSALLGYEEEDVRFFEEHLRKLKFVVTEEALQWQVGDNVTLATYELELQIGFRTPGGKRAPCVNIHNRFKYITKKDYTLRELCILHERSVDHALWAFIYRHRSLYVYNEKPNRWFEVGSLDCHATRGDPAYGCCISATAVEGLGLTVVEATVIPDGAFLMPYFGEVKTKPSITSSYQVKITDDPPRYLDAQEHGSV